jgi:hypothetical protein
VPFIIAGDRTIVVPRATATPTRATDAAETKEASLLVILRPAASLSLFFIVVERVRHVVVDFVECRLLHRGILLFIFIFLDHPVLLTRIDLLPHTSGIRVLLLLLLRPVPPSPQNASAALLSSLKHLLLFLWVSKRKQIAILSVPLRAPCMALVTTTRTISPLAPAQLPATHSRRTRSAQCSEKCLVSASATGKAAGSKRRHIAARVLTPHRPLHGKPFEQCRFKLPGACAATVATATVAANLSRVKGTYGCFQHLVSVCVSCAAVDCGTVDAQCTCQHTARTVGAAARTPARSFGGVGIGAVVAVALDRRSLRS